MAASKNNIFVFENSDDLSSAVAKFVAEKSAEAIEKRGKFTVAFSGGSLPSLVARLYFLFLVPFFLPPFIDIVHRFFERKALF